MQSDPAIDDAARAILSGSAPDWDSLDSSDDSDTRAIAEQLKVLSALAQVHRAAPAAEAPPDRWGHLQLLDKVGAGAFGDVYRAWDPRLARDVALKLLPAAAIASDGPSLIITEGRLLARVRHPGVATIHGADLIDGRVGLWMEFVRGHTLEELLRGGHRFTQAEALSIGLDLSRAVAAVHAAGLVHRDIKAQNVMRADDGRIVLTDFGTGRVMADDAPSRAGTPLYLAPELFRGQPATVRSDIYSVGVLLFRLLAGSYPVTGTTVEDLRRAHERGDAISIRSVRPDLPPRLARVVDRATAADPADRYETGDALAADLARLTQVPRTGRYWLAAAAISGLLAVGWLGWPGGGTDATGAATATVVPAALAPSERPVIVVRPFRSVNASVDGDLLADGLTYELIRGLNNIDGLEVRSATSSLALKGQEITLADIGARLGVNLVVDGTLFWSGDRVRIQAQLAHVGSDRALWTGKFDQALTDVLKVQDEIALAVVNQLRLTLGKGQRRYDLDQEALTLYLKGRALVERRDPEDVKAAQSLFEQVIARDAGFAPAYAGLCTAFGFQTQALPDVLGLPHQQALALMRDAATRALELDPLLAEAHAAMGFLHALDFADEDMWDAADQSFGKAIALNPTLTHVYTSYSLTTLLPMGRFDEAEALLREAIRRDPDSLEARRELGFALLTAGHIEDAMEALGQVAAIDPAFPAVQMLLARARSLAGHIDEAMPYWESVRDTLGLQHWMAYAFVRAGRRAEIARLAAAETHPLRQTLYYAALGETDRALDALAEAAEASPHRTVRTLQYPELAGLRDDPRFDALLARFHLQ